jgi:hypothetical protein
LLSLEIVNPDVIGHAAAVMLPGAEFAENAIESHFRIVRRERSKASTRYGQSFRQISIHADGFQIANKRIEGSTPGAKDNFRLSVCPAHHDIVRTHAIGNVVARKSRGGGQAFRLSTFARHNINFCVAVVLRSEGELFSVGRKMRERAVTRSTG